MNDMILLPCTLDSQEIIIRTWLPVDENTLLIPGETITFGCLQQPGRLITWYSMKKYVRNNLPEYILHAPRDDKIIVFSGNEKFLYFISVNAELWRHWQRIIAKNYPDRTRYLPDWMLLPVPSTPDGVGMMIQGRWMYRRNFMNGTSFSASKRMLSVQRSLAVMPEDGPLLPIMQTRFTQSRPVLKADKLTCLSRLINLSVLMIYLPLAVLIVQLLCAGVILSTPPSAQAPDANERPFIVSYKALTGMSDKFPLTTEKIYFDSDSTIFTVRSRSTCDRLLAFIESVNKDYIVKSIHPENMRCISQIEIKRGKSIVGK